MGPGIVSSKAKTLRDHLRGATAHSHDLLDKSMRPGSDWRSKKDYARFLQRQYCARISIECWLSMYAPAGLKPPEQTPLLARDLIALGETIPYASHKFELDCRSDATVVGVAWVLAGSSLGNRAMLHDMNKTLSEGARRPSDFLSSTAMTEFWKALRARIEAPADEIEAKEATRAAARVFEHFLALANLALAGPGLVHENLEDAI